MNDTRKTVLAQQAGYPIKKQHLQPDLLFFHRLYLRLLAAILFLAVQEV
jgi:hypothetical protein